MHMFTYAHFADKGSRGTVGGAISRERAAQLVNGRGKKLQSRRPFVSPKLDCVKTIELEPRDGYRREYVRIRSQTNGHANHPPQIHNPFSKRHYLTRNRSPTTDITMPTNSPLVTLPAATDGEDVHKIHPEHVRRISPSKGRDESTYPVAVDRTRTEPAREPGAVVVVGESRSHVTGDIGKPTISYTRVYTTLSPDEAEERLFGNA